MKWFIPSQRRSVSATRSGISGDPEPLLIKVRFCQKALLKFLPYLQTEEQEHLTSLNLKIWVLVVSKAALARQMLPSCPYTHLNFQTLKFIYSKKNFPKFSISKQFSVTKIQIFKLRKIMYKWLMIWQMHQYFLKVTFRKTVFKEFTKLDLAIYIFNISSVVEFCF